MLERLCKRHIVLLGFGHTNAHVVRMWGMQPIPDTDLTCISNFTIATYSACYPLLAGYQIPQEQMEIDLVQYCSSVGVRLITTCAIGLMSLGGKSNLSIAPQCPMTCCRLALAPFRRLTP
ncbi:MAG: hypothetical protein R3C53_07215 [Pirellulaceae bacterium]